MKSVLALAAVLPLGADTSCARMLPAYKCGGDLNTTYRFERNEEDDTWTLFVSNYALDADNSFGYFCQAGVLKPDTQEDDFLKYLESLSPADRNKFRKHRGEYRAIGSTRIKFTVYDPDGKKLVDTIFTVE